MALITTHCPDWEYTNVPGFNQILEDRAIAALLRLRGMTPTGVLAICKDTRPLHARYFHKLTPPDFDYYAGNYRGSNFECLRHSMVHIPSDPLVGHPPDRISDDMLMFSRDFESLVSESDFLWAVNQQVVSPAEKLYRVVQLAAALFVYLLQIHPFKNGNGHMARFFLIAYLSRYGIFLSKWPLHGRPPDPPYSELIGKYRRGDRKSFEMFVLGCI